MIATLITALHLTALAQIESGDNDRAVGKQGEVSRYQVLPDLARKEFESNPALRGQRIPKDWALRRKIADQVATGLWQKRVDTFRVAYRREPTLQELYLCWHRPGRVLNPKPAELERAKRFANVFTVLNNESHLCTSATPLHARSMP